MKKSVFLLLAFLFFGGAFAAQQQPSRPPERVSTDELQELVRTLESETARKQLIGDLKTLIEVKRSQQGAEETTVEDNDAVLTPLQAVKRKYQKLLKRYGLDGSVLGQIWASLLIFAVAGFLTWLVRTVSIYLHRQSRKLKSRFSLQHHRFELYARILRYGGYALVACLFVYMLVVTWKITSFEFLKSNINGTLLTGLLHIVLILIVALSLWEVLNTLIEYALRKADEGSGNRLRTLLPIARNFLLLILICLFALVILSEVGVDIMPLLAGAGIFGIAIGFGAQTFVKDLLTGFTIIFEDLVQVGDVIRVADRTGLVERITIRKIQLRDLNGIVYTVPFSEINTIENWTKDYSYYVLDIGIAYREDPDKVIACLKEIDESMRADDHYKRLILAPIEILGVDSFAENSIIIKARIKTLPIKQWDVGREFNRRMKRQFDEKGIEMPFPHQVVYFGGDKQGHPLPLHILQQRMPESDD